MADVALVTGANRGIGRAIAKQLKDAGLDVVGTARSREAADEVASALGIESVVFDVTDAGAVPGIVERFADGLDVLVNNAGVALNGFDADVVRRTLAVNVDGPIRLTDALLGRLRPNARIVNVSSGMGELDCVSRALAERFLAVTDREGLRTLMDEFTNAVEAGTHGKQGWPSSAYRVSKVGLNTFTRVLDRDLSTDDRRIAVNAMCPGWVATDMGGAGAPRTPDEGARTAVWLATQGLGGPRGGFFRDNRPVDW